MELTIKVDDKEGPFLIELLRKFSFVQEVKPKISAIDLSDTEELWQSKASKLFGSKADFDLWLNSPNAAAKHQKPADLMDNEAGYRTVQKLLGRLEHGIMA